MNTPTPPRTLTRHMTDDQVAAQMADAVWYDVRSKDYGRAQLRHHHRYVNGHLAWRFPYADRVYVAHRSTGNSATWDVSLYLAPSAPDTSDLPRTPDTAPATHGSPLVTGHPTLKNAVRQLVLDMRGTPCDHGYTRSQDSCPGCDTLNDLYDTLP